MQTLSHVDNDELDLLELLEVIWAGKFLLLPIVVFFMSVGGVIAFNAERSYETKLPIFLNLVPPPFMGYDVTNELELMLERRKIILRMAREVAIIEHRVSRI